MLSRLFSLDYRRRKLAAQTPPGPLRDYLETPFSCDKTSCQQSRFLALDLETSGLDPLQDTIISFGWVQLDGAHIRLGSARHRLVRQYCAIPEASAIIHQITDDDAATAGAELEEVLVELLAELAGKVLIAHHAKIETGFIDAACRRLFGGRFLVPVVDTLYLARRSLMRHQEVLRPNDLRLGNLRKRYNLPRYAAHNALTDAMAAAELFLAQLAERGNEKPVRLREMLVPA